MLYLALAIPAPPPVARTGRYPFDTVHVEVPEVRAPGEPPADYVSRVAREKAGAGLLELAAWPALSCSAPIPKSCSATRCLAKPADAAHATAMLRRLSGRSHQAISAVWCVSAGREERALSVSEVAFAALSESAIAAYVASGEPIGRAGAYAIQGRAAAFISRLSGSYSAVMGLPLFETVELLRRFGIGPAE
jgi:septum formation protein